MVCSELEKAHVFGAGSLGRGKAMRQKAGDVVGRVRVLLEDPAYCAEHTADPQLTWAPYKGFAWLVEDILIYNPSDF